MIISSSMTKIEDILTEDYVVRCFTARAEYIALAKLSHSFEILLVEFPVIPVDVNATMLAHRGQADVPDITFDHNFIYPQLVYLGRKHLVSSLA